MILIRFILIAILAAILLTVLRVWRFMRQAKQAARDLQDKMNDAWQQAEAQTTTDSNGQTVVDRRNSEQRSRKIIPRDEGEYVDFTETE